VGKGRLEDDRTGGMARNQVDTAVAGSALNRR
jgi:hypothetical protein